MKKVLVVVVVLSLLVSCAITVMADEYILTGYSDEQLNHLEAAIQAEREKRANQMEVPVDVPVEEAVAESPDAQPATEPTGAEATAFEPMKIGSRGDNVVALQNKLNELGFDVGKADGILGAKSEAAVKALQKKLGREETGVVSAQEDLDEILGLKKSDGTNLATGTDEAVTVTACGEDSWCVPFFLFPTSNDGLAMLADNSNKYYTVSFDWAATGVDTAVNAGISLRYTEEKTWYAPVGFFSLPTGDSNGHCAVTFIPNDEMRRFGTDWLIGGIGEGPANRNIQITISNFRFEAGF